MRSVVDRNVGMRHMTVCAKILYAPDTEFDFLATGNANRLILSRYIMAVYE